MAINRDLKVGDRIKPLAGMLHFGQYRSGEVVAIAVRPLCTSVWLKAEDSSGVEWFLTFDGHMLQKDWTLIPETFEIGHTYEFTDSNGYLYKVLDIYDVVNPATMADTVTVVAVATDEEGFQHISVFNEGSRSRMREVTE